ILKWVDARRSPEGEKYIYAFAFLSVLALGIHMTSFLVVPITFLFMLVIERRLIYNLPFLMSFVVLSIVPVSVTVYLILSALWAAIATSVYFWDKIKNGWIYTIFIPLIIFLGAISFGYSWIPILIYCLAGWSLVTLVIYRLQPSKRAWRMGMLITLFGLLGFSSQLYTPIRSFSDPAIDMNDPETWESVRDFLERKQYGTESMFARMLDRRGTWENQFGTHERMGFWGFFHEQYSAVKGFWLLFPLGIFGVIYAIRRKWKPGTFLLFILLASTVGLVLYMNFADGTQENARFGIDHLEVRDRDYFFTPGFILFGLFIGIGIAGIIHAVMKFLSKSQVSDVVKKIVMAVLALTILLPVMAYSENYFYCDRSENYLPYNYAKNLLSSCRENAILFTNGDNDTFPLWCLQYAYGIRPDVRVIVITLLRADWYIKQHRDKFDVPISFSDDDINLLRPIEMENGFYSISNLVIDNIINNAAVKSSQPGLWPDLPMRYSDFLKKYRGKAEGDTSLFFDPPIEFATTVDANGMRFRGKSIAESPVHAVIEGLAYNIHPDQLPYNVNAEFTSNYFLNEFNAQGVTDTTMYMDDNAKRLAENYWKIMAKMAEEVFNAGSMDKAIDMNFRAAQISQNPAEAFRFLAKNLKNAGRIEEINEYMAKIERASEVELMESAGHMLDILFAMEISQYKNELRKQGLDPAAAADSAAQAFADDQQYRYYLNFLERFKMEYPGNQMMRTYIDRASDAVLNKLSSEKLEELGLNLERSGSDSPTIQPGG
ncbi:MAG: DUF2723 domain-containing protein, partial [candidate division Zixibacteria bacterium]|nr:DUF2723 domain-containing protein [candidate division Zixibacteria bacterium]NIR67669.1 DUF2723 domain-containing protein [candidate division Zixibacteria bacterium]NIS17092.1 DUF2723 domain-containing protein [candidate division Zixibacteria bacterium]NIS48927.1 DUF2723 domain-containing protein [candidate division Zixibacteria bacterium]NIT53142.1 DUF2723 domain-containing protein [candidate division Zixibacteria bacterium]